MGYYKDLDIDLSNKEFAEAAERGEKFIKKYGKTYCTLCLKQQITISKPIHSADCPNQAIKN